MPRRANRRDRAIIPGLAIINPLVYLTELSLSVAFISSSGSSFAPWRWSIHAAYLARSLSPPQRMAMVLHLPCIRARFFLPGQGRQESGSSRRARPAAVGTICRRRYHRQMLPAAQLATPYRLLTPQVWGPDLARFVGPLISS